MFLVLTAIQLSKIQKLNNNKLARSKYDRKKATVKFSTTNIQPIKNKSNFPLKFPSTKFIYGHTKSINENNSNSILLSRKNTEASEGEKTMNLKLNPFSNKFLPNLNTKKEFVNNKLLDSKVVKLCDTHIKFLPSFNSKIPVIKDRSKKEFTGNEIKKSKSNLLISKNKFL